MRDEIQQRLHEERQAMKSVDYSCKRWYRICTEAEEMLEDTDPFWVTCRYEGERRAWLPPIGKPGPWYGELSR